MNPSRHFDHIVIGTGSMGAATCWQLAKSGRSVLGIDRFSVPHDRGSHGGETRIIRKAYFEHPDYIPLLESAYRGWEKLEEESGQQLYFRTGLLYAGPHGSSVLEGVKRSVLEYEIELERLEWSGSQSSRFRIPSDYELLFEPDAGFLKTEIALESLLRVARERGAVFLKDTLVTGWYDESGTVKVETSAGVFTCEKLVVTAGAWSGRLLPDLSSKLTVTRQVLAWYDVQRPDWYGLGDFPCWLIAEDGLPGPYYGFPATDDTSGGDLGQIKVAYHHRGEVADPDSTSGPVTEEELSALNAFVSRTFEGISDKPARTSVCYYVNSPDDHFIIDHRGPVTFACGFSGHGFKFVPVIGEILADLSMNGSTLHPIGFLRADRFD